MDNNITITDFLTAGKIVFAVVYCIFSYIIYLFIYRYVWANRYKWTCSEAVVSAHQVLFAIAPVGLIITTFFGLLSLAGMFLSWLHKQAISGID